MKRLPATTIYSIEAVVSSFLFNSIFTVSSIYYVKNVGLNPMQLVLVGTALEASAFVFEIPTGVVADVYSRRLSVIIGYVLTGIAFLWMGLAPFFFPIVLSQVLWGLGYTFTSGAWQAWIADEVGEERVGEIFVRGSQLNIVGSLLGIAASMALGSLDVTVPILVSAVLFLALAGFLAGWMPETGFKPTLRGERKPWQQMGHTLREGVGLIRRRPMLQTILLVGLFLGLYSEGYDRLNPAHLLQDFTLPYFSPVIWFGLLRLATQLVNLGGIEWVRRRLDPNKPHTHLPVLVSSCTGLLAGLLIFAMSRSLGLALGGYFIVSFTRNLNEPYYTAWLNGHTDPRVRATLFSVSGQMDALGQILGGPLLGAVGSAWGVRAALLGSVALLAPVMFFFSRARKDQEPVTELLSE